MKTLIVLTKMQIKVYFGISALKHRFAKEKSRIWQTLMIGLGVVAGVGSLVWVYTVFLLGLFSVAKSFNQPEIVLTLAFVAAQTIVLVFGLFYVLSTFYYSRDMETFVPLPLKPYEIVGSKFAVVLLYEYVTTAPLLLPAIIIFGAGTGQTVIYWIKALVVYLLIPTIPLTIGALFIMILMRVVNLRRNKDLFAMIAGFAGLILALAFNVVFQRMPEEMGADYFAKILSDENGLIRLAGRRFPPSLWATYGLTAEGAAGIGYFLLFVAVSLALAAVMLLTADLVFYKALLAGQEVTRRHKAYSGREVNKRFEKTSSAIKAIFAREWKLLVRTPVYMINGMTGMIIGPLIIAIMFLSRSGRDEMSAVIEALNNPVYSAYVLLGSLGLMLFTSGMNIVPSTSVSREANTFWVAKMIPVEGKSQVISKFLHGYAISAIGIFATAVVLVAAIGLKVLSILLVVVIALIASVSIVAFGLLVDLLRPKMVWTTEQEAMKQNFNGFLGMIISVAVIAVLAAAAFVPLALKLPPYMAFIFILCAAAILDAISLLILMRNADRKYSELEA